MTNKKNIPLLASFLLVLSACTTSSLMDSIPDRRPDYKTSQISSKIEVPPDLSARALNDTMDVSDLSPSVVANYSDYQNAQVKRDDRGFIQVLPQLYKVTVDQPNGELPYIVVDAPAEQVWQAVKKYWQYNGIRLAIEQPTIGIMETDWLENTSGAPKTGISGFLNNLLGFVNDSGERDRYRIRFTRLSNNQTEVLVIYNQSKEYALHDIQSGKDPAGFTWKITDNQNPEFQLEMTRRIALYVAAQLKSQQGIEETNESKSTEQKSKQSQANTSNLGKTLLTTVNGEPALRFAGSYALAWRILGIGLDKASFSITNQDMNTGTYQVRYEPQTNAESPSIFAAMWGAKNGVKTKNPEYLIRLADQKSYSVAVVQKLDGSPANNEEAKALLETINSAL